MNTGLQQRLGLAAPIVLAPMAGSTTPALAAAVSNAGALGSHGCAALSIEQARQDIRQIAASTAAPFNVNFFCHQAPSSNPGRDAEWVELLSPYFREFDTEPPSELTLGYKGLNENPEMVAMLLEEKPPIISFHFGLPTSDIVRQLKAAGILLFGCATNLSDARAIESAGLDAIIVQGFEAGGHRGVFNVAEDTEAPLLPLLKEISSHCQLPLIAAGGIMTGAHIAAALQAGADLVQMGTAFLLCPEANTNEAYRAALTASTGSDTSIISVISGRPARGLSNRLHAELGDKAALMPDYPYPYSASKALTAASIRSGSEDFLVHWSGTGVEHIRALPTAELVATLQKELAEALAG